MSILSIILLTCIDLLMVPVAGVARLFVRRSNEYATSVYIAAPVRDVWEVSTARDITLDGWPPLTMTSRDIPELPEAFQISFDVFGETVTMGFRQIELREGESVLYEILPAYTSPEATLGTEHYAAFSVEAEGRGTRLASTYRLYDGSIFNRVMVPFSMRVQLRRIKRHVEARIDEAT